MTFDPHASSRYYFVIGHDHLRNRRFEEARAAYQKINLPDYFATWRALAVVYAHLGREDDAKDAVRKMLDLYPGYEHEVRDYLRDWNLSGEFESLTLEGLRKAGLEIPRGSSDAD